MLSLGSYSMWLRLAGFGVLILGGVMLVRLENYEPQAVRKSNIIQCSGAIILFVGYIVELA